jgi:hypothetical protein
MRLQMNILLITAAIITSTAAQEATTISAPFTVETQAVVIPCITQHEDGACVTVGNQKFFVPTNGYAIPIGSEMRIGFTVTSDGDTLKIVNIYDAD